MIFPTKEELNKIKLRKAFFEMAQFIRNGAICVGNSPSTQDYRKTCLERAYWALCHELSPFLLANGSLEETQELMNLLDTTAMIQQTLIHNP